MVVMVASNACAAKCWFGATALPASVSTYTEKFGPDAADLPAQPSHTLRETVWADDRHGRLKAIGGSGTCPGRSPTSCLESPANHAGQCYVRGVPTIGRPHGGSNQFRATDPTGTTSDEPDDEKQNNATYAGVDGSY
jgi:hypothetical protein